MASEVKIIGSAQFSGLPWTLQIEIASLSGTAALGHMLARAYAAGMFIGLSGELGSGKTELVRAIVSALGGRPEELASPSYVLQCIYPLPLSDEKALSAVHHWDWYRLQGEMLPPELTDERTSQGVLTLVEWPERIEEWEAIEDLRCRMDFIDDAEGSERRKVSLVIKHKALAERLSEIFKGTDVNEK